MATRRAVILLLVLAGQLGLGLAATVRSFPNYDYGGKSHAQFLTDAIERSSPSNARLLAELFGGLELGLGLGIDTGSGDGSGASAKAVVSVGGAATRCQHQSPCFDARCRLCYDPLLRIHGRCGGASYFTCRGTLPKGCLPYSCTARAGRQMSPDNHGTPIFVKKFPRFEDPFCLGRIERARSVGRNFNVNTTDLNSIRDDTTSLREHPLDSAPDAPDPSWALSVPDAVTPCQAYDLCVDLGCGTCYDAYLGAHVSCGRMTYYDCRDSLPRECRPLKCTDSDVRELFPMGKNGTEGEEGEDAGTPLMVRSFEPLVEDKKNCL